MLQQSKPNWLDRLRISKGFTSDTPNPNHNPSSDVHRRRPPPPSATTATAADLITNVLADLFIMGSPPPPRSSKSSRKQPRPKLRRPSSFADSSSAAPPAAKPRRKRAVGAPAESDLSAYSRTEVTVIDTSCSPAWKSDKLIFRKGTVWKVRDKKVRIGFRKKRKVAEKQDSETTGSKEPVASNEPWSCTHKIDASEETDDQIQLPIRRPKFSRSTRVPAAKDSSLFHL